MRSQLFSVWLDTQAEIWNCRLAIIGFVAYLLWDLASYSVLRDALYLIGY